jgi:hypothetical protein
MFVSPATIITKAKPNFRRVACVLRHGLGIIPSRKSLMQGGGQNPAGAAKPPVVGLCVSAQKPDRDHPNKSEIICNLVRLWPRNKMRTAPAIGLAIAQAEAIEKEATLRKTEHSQP